MIYFLAEEAVEGKIVENVGKGLEILEKIEGIRLWKMSGNLDGFPQRGIRDSFPQAMWIGKRLFCGKLGGKCGNQAALFWIIW